MKDEQHLFCEQSEQHWSKIEDIEKFRYTWLNSSYISSKRPVIIAEFAPFDLEGPKVFYLPMVYKINGELYPVILKHFELFGGRE